jgi:hypothetical protein
MRKRLRTPGARPRHELSREEYIERQARTQEKEKKKKRNMFILLGEEERKKYKRKEKMHIEQKEASICLT